MSALEKYLVPQTPAPPADGGSYEKYLEPATPATSSTSYEKYLEPAPQSSDAGDYEKYLQPAPLSSATSHVTEDVDVGEETAAQRAMFKPLEFKPYDKSDLSKMGQAAAGFASFAGGGSATKLPDSSPLLVGKSSRISIPVPVGESGPRAPSPDEVADAYLSTLGSEAVELNRKYRSETGRNIVSLEVSSDDLNKSFNPQSKAYELDVNPTQGALRILNAYGRGGLSEAQAEVGRIHGENSTDLTKLAQEQSEPHDSHFHSWAVLNLLAPAEKEGLADAGVGAAQLVHNTTMLPRAMWTAAVHGYDSKEYQALQREDEATQRQIYYASSSIPDEQTTSGKFVRGVTRLAASTPALMVAGPEGVPLVTYMSNLHKGNQYAATEAVKTLPFLAGGKLLGGLLSKAAGGEAATGAQFPRSNILGQGEPAVLESSAPSGTSPAPISELSEAQRLAQGLRESLRKLRAGQLSDEQIKGLLTHYDVPDVAALDRVWRGAIHHLETVESLESAGAASAENLPSRVISGSADEMNGDYEGMARRFHDEVQKRGYTSSSDFDKAESLALEALEGGGSPQDAAARLGVVLGREFPALEGAGETSLMKGPTLSKQDALKALYDVPLHDAAGSSVAYDNAVRAGIPDAHIRAALVGESVALDDAGATFSPSTVLKRTFKENLYSVLNLPRSIITAGDLSASARQGAVLSAGHPVRAAQAFVKQIKAFVSEGAARDAMAELQSGPMAAIRQDAGLFLPDLEDSTLSAAAREEAFGSSLAKHVPLVNRSERAFNVFLNKMRADVFDDIYASHPGLAPEELKEVARTLNVLTGRGSLGPLNQHAADVAQILFAPRLLASRIQTPLLLASKSPAARAEAARSIVSFLGANLAFLGAAKMAGADITLDPRSSDFMRVKVGNTRIDLMAGYQAPIRYAAQLLMGQRKNVDTGDVKPTSRTETAKHLVRTRLAPQVGIPLDLATGSNVAGEKVGPVDAALSGIEYLSARDIIEAVKEDRRLGGSGWRGAGLGSLSLFGVGVSTYHSKPATKKQLDFIDILSDMTKEHVETKNLSAAQASKIINRLKGKAKLK